MSSIATDASLTVTEKKLTLTDKEEIDKSQCDSNPILNSVMEHSSTTSTPPSPFSHVEEKCKDESSETITKLIVRILK